MAALNISRVIYQHPLAYLLALQGGALLRAFNGEYDREFTQARLSEIRALLDSADEFGDGVTTRAVTTAEGYDPAAAPAPERVLPEHPSDIWTLRGWCPAAARAASSGRPCLIFWHFQLA